MRLGARLRQRAATSPGGPTPAGAPARPEPSRSSGPSARGESSALGPMADRLARALGLPAPAGTAAVVGRTGALAGPSSTRGGPGWARTEERLPLSRIDLGALGAVAHAWPGAHALARDLAELSGDPELRVPLVLDLETTGLSPGGGAIPAVVGTCGIEHDHVVVRQWVLGRGGAEGAMLADVADALRPALEGRAALVTFNGKSFDWPVLAARLHRWHPHPAAPAPEVHVDLLAIARRVLDLPELPDHRLGTLERRVLGIERVADVSGADVARILHRALLAPDDPWAAAARRRVLEHNRADVLTPLLLVARLAAIVRTPGSAREALGAARHLAAIRRPAAALLRLETWLETELETGLEGTRAGDTAAIALALAAAELRRRSGDHDGAAQWWVRVCAWAPGHALAHERLAKHLEHRRRDPAAALAIAVASQAPCARRLRRLAAKVARSGVCSPGNGLARGCEPGAGAARV